MQAVRLRLHVRPTLREESAVPHAFVPSPHVTRTDGRKIDLIVVHTMEMDEKGDTAESCARWFQNPTAKVSAHYCVDANSIVQCVRDQDVGWHAPGANHDGIGIEHAGRAKQTGREWGDAYSAAMLERSAELVAGLCRRYGIPVKWLYAADLVAGKRGITTHDAVSKAFKRGSHWDPGQGFPVEKYLSMVRARLAGTELEPEPQPQPDPERDLASVTDPAPLKDDPPTLRRGSEGWQVKRLQRLLVGHGLLPDETLVDGDFGEITEAAVRGFQELNDLGVDGIAGPLTWHALQTLEPTVPVAPVQKPVLQPDAV
jgi:N-acetyl-anhydromuramyl-L-alanine amidase AmpD